MEPWPWPWLCPMLVLPPTLRWRCAEGEDGCEDEPCACEEEGEGGGMELGCAVCAVGGAGSVLWSNTSATACTCSMAKPDVCYRSPHCTASST